MNAKSLSILLAITVLVGFCFLEEAQALKVLARLNPKNAKASGFEIKVSPNKRTGLIDFVIHRDLSKVRKFPDNPELMTDRGAHLRLYSKKGLVADCPIQDMVKKGKGTYRFSISKDHIEHSTFTVTEIDAYKDPDRTPLLGGGTYFEIRLKEFATNSERRR